MLRHTRLQPVPGLDNIRLHLSDDVFSVWGAVQRETGDSDAPIPYWAFAWGGGLAIARYLAEHQEAVAGRRVLDVASGSGLCAIAAARARAADVTAVDIDPYAVAAIGLNAKANRVRVEPEQIDLLGDEPPDIDVVLAGDAWYEEQFATRVSAWLQRASEAGIHVIIGDPGRRYLAHDRLQELATYETRSTTDLEDIGRTTATVYALR